MSPETSIPPIQEVKRESCFVRRGVQKITTLTKVIFRDGRAITFTGSLDRKEAFFQGYFQRALEMGLPEDQARGVALARPPAPLKGGFPG